MLTLPSGAVIRVMRPCASRLKTTLAPEEWMIPLGVERQRVPVLVRRALHAGRLVDDELHSLVVVYR